ncbi:hypothetical protein B5D77_02790 [Microcystis sp. MC19]|nr:hypothetical protein B5D77_02790 [Microcystis sp. MC19]
MEGTTPDTEDTKNKRASLGVENHLSREAQLFVGWVSGSVTHAGVGFHASTQPTFILYLIPPTHLSVKRDSCQWAKIKLIFSHRWLN